MKYYKPNKPEMCIIMSKKSYGKRGFVKISFKKNSFDRLFIQQKDLLIDLLKDLFIDLFIELL